MDRRSALSGVDVPGAASHGFAWDDVLTGGVFSLAVAAWVVAASSFLGALRVSRGHPPFEARRGMLWHAGMPLIPAMPPAARRHLRRFRFAFAVFFGCILVSFIIGLARAGVHG